jgi:hypothetical protein
MARAARRRARRARCARPLPLNSSSAVPDARHAGRVRVCVCVRVCAARAQMRASSLADAPAEWDLARGVLPSAPPREAPAAATPPYASDDDALVRGAAAPEALACGALGAPRAYGAEHPPSKYQHTACQARRGARRAGPSRGAAHVPRPPRQPAGKPHSARDVTSPAACVGLLRSRARRCTAAPARWQPARRTTRATGCARRTCARTAWPSRARRADSARRALAHFFSRLVASRARALLRAPAWRASSCRRRALTRSHPPAAPVQKCSRFHPIGDFDVRWPPLLVRSTHGQRGTFFRAAASGGGCRRAAPLPRLRAARCAPPCADAPHPPPRSARGAPAARSCRRRRGGAPP